MSEIAPPVMCAWDGEVFRPENARMAKIADTYYAVGGRYKMVEQKDRSMKSHSHFFAVINDAHGNLPDHLLGEYPTPEALRKKLLIKCGYADEESLVLDTHEDAIRFAAMAKRLDTVSVVVVEGRVVKRFTAHSQSIRAMGSAEFQKSKDDLFRALDELLGIEAGQTQQNAGRAA